MMAAKHKEEWTDEEVVLLRRLYLLFTRAEIAVMIGRTETAVRAKLYKLVMNTKHPALDPSIRMRIFCVYSSDKPVDLPALEKELGMLRSNISREARKMGLTDPTRKRAIDGVAISERIKKQWATQGHPRGALGMKHTPEAKQKMVAATKRAWEDPNSKFNSKAFRQAASDRMMRMQSMQRGAGWNPYSSAKRGRREDLGNIFFRSRWEANFARWLNRLVASRQIKSWEHEPHTFWFWNIKRGVRSYLPDFKVTFPDGHHEWWEVKGWMDKKSKTKLDRMKRYFPEEKVRVFGTTFFREAIRTGVAASCPHWEFAPGWR